MRVYKNLCNKGFTLVELLVVIAIIAILFAVVLVAINPAQRFKDSRNSRRLSDVKSIVEAATTYTADRRGAQLPDVPDYQCVGTKPADSFSANPTGSTAVWKFDNSPNDAVPVDNLLTSNSTTYTTGSSGKFGEAIQMNGSTSSLSTGDHVELDPVSSALTVEGWIKLNQKIEPGTFDHHLPIFDKANYQLRLNSDSGKLEFDVHPLAGGVSALTLEYQSNTDSVTKINALAQFGDSLYAGTESGGGKILIKNSGNWSVLSGYPSTTADIKALTVYNNKLYSGELTNGDNSARVFSFDGNSWSDTGLNIADASVLSLTRYKGKLYAGIGIEPPNTGGASIWEYDGTSWRSSKDFATNEALAVYAFTVYGGKLYAGTGRGLDDQDARVYEFDGNSWLQKFFSIDFGGSRDAVYSLAVYDKSLVIGLGGNNSGDAAVYKWDGSAPSPSLYGVPPSYGTPSTEKHRVLSLTVSDRFLQAGWSGTADGDAAVYYYDTSLSSWVGRSDNFTTKEIGSLMMHKGILYAGTGGDDASNASIQPWGYRKFVESQKTVWQPNAWYHVAGTYDGTVGQIKIYVNGIDNSSSASSIPGALFINAKNLYIGSGYRSDPFSGVLDNLAIYNNTALSADTIASHAGCYNLGQYLAPEYMGSLPIDPSSTVTDGTDTGYFISKDTGGVITITAPLTETSSSIPEIIKASR